MQKKNHIGRLNGTNMLKIFEELYGDIRNYTKFQMYFIWTTLIKPEMNWLRKTTNCFIGVERDGTDWTYFVVKDKKDIEFYVHILETSAKRCKAMVKRANKAVEEKHYKKL